MTGKRRPMLFDLFVLNHFLWAHGTFERLEEEEEEDRLREASLSRPFPALRTGVGACEEQKFTGFVGLSRFLIVWLWLKTNGAILG